MHVYIHNYIKTTLLHAYILHSLHRHANIHHGEQPPDLSLTQRLRFMTSFVRIIPRGMRFGMRRFQWGRPVQMVSEAEEPHQQADKIDHHQQ